MPYVAHRGVLVDGTTENTIDAMRHATERGADVEIDLRTTADHQVVLMHDRKVARTTDGRGLVAKKTAAKVRKLRTDDGQQVPFARAALTLVRDHPGTAVVLDLKALTPQSTAVLIALIEELGIAEQVSVISFQDPLIASFRAADIGIDTFKITGTLPSPADAAIYGGVNVFGELVTEAWVDSMREAGVPFNLRVSDDTALWDLAVRVGSGWVMTDTVDAWRAYCAPA